MKSTTTFTILCAMLVASASAWGLDNPGADPTARQCRRSCASNCGADLNPTACKRTCEAEHRCSAKPSPAVAFWPAASARTCNDVLECPGREGDGASCLHLSGDRDPTRKVCCAAGDHRDRGAHFRCARVATGTGPRNQCDWDEQCDSGRCDLETHHCVAQCRVEAAGVGGDDNACPASDLCPPPLWATEQSPRDEGAAAAAARTRMLAKAGIKAITSAVGKAFDAVSGGSAGFLFGPIGSIIESLAFPPSPAVCAGHTGTADEQGLCLWGLTSDFVKTYFGDKLASYDDTLLARGLRGVRDLLEEADRAFTIEGEHSAIGHAKMHRADDEMTTLKNGFLPDVASRRILGTHFAQFGSLHLAIKTFIFDYDHAQGGDANAERARESLTDAIDSYVAYGEAASRVILRERMSKVGGGTIPASLDLWTADTSRACTDMSSGYCNVEMKGHWGMLTRHKQVNHPKVNIADDGKTCPGTASTSTVSWKASFTNGFARDFFRGGTLKVDPMWGGNVCGNAGPAAVAAARCLQARFDLVLEHELAMWNDVVLENTAQWKALNRAVCASGAEVCDASVAAAAGAKVRMAAPAATTSRMLRGA